MCKRHRTRRPPTDGQDSGNQQFSGRSARTTGYGYNPGGVHSCVRFAKKISNRASDRLGNMIRLMREMGLTWWASYKAARKLCRLNRGSDDPMVRARKADSAVFRMAWSFQSSRRAVLTAGRSAIREVEGILWRPRDKLATRFATATVDMLDEQIFGELEHGHGERAYLKYARRGLETVINSGMGSLVQTIHAGGSAFLTGMCPCGSHVLSYGHCYKFWALRCRRLCDSARDLVASELISTDEGWKRFIFEAGEVLDHSGMLIDGLNAAVFHGVVSVLLPLWAKVLLSAGKKVAYIITGDRYLGAPSSRPKLGETDRLLRSCAICGLYMTAEYGEYMARGLCVSYMLAIAIGNGRGVEQVGVALDRLWPNLLGIASGKLAGGRVCWPLV